MKITTRNKIYTINIIGDNSGVREKLFLALKIIELKLDNFSGVYFPIADAWYLNKEKDESCDTYNFLLCDFCRRYKVDFEASYSIQRLRAMGCTVDEFPELNTSAI